MKPAKVTSDLFEPLTPVRTAPGHSGRPAKAERFLAGCLRRFVKNRGALIGFILLLVIAAMTFVAPALSPYDPYEQKLEEQNRPPDGARFSRDRSIRTGPVDSNLARWGPMPSGSVSWRR